MKTQCVSHMVYKPGLGYWPLDRIPMGTRLIDGLNRPYMVLQVPEDADEALRRRARGFDHLGVHWTMRDCVVREKEGTTFFMFPESDRSVSDDPVMFRRQLNRVSTVADGDWAGLVKSQKYWKREYAPHKTVVEGKITERLEDGFICELQNPFVPGVCRKTYIRTPEVDDSNMFAVDGMHLVRPGMAEFLTGEKRVKPGRGFMVTADTPAGEFSGSFWKGHGLVWPGRWDMVMFGGKKLLGTINGHVRIAILNELHTGGPGSVYSDLQSMINFRSADLMPSRVKAVMKEFLEKMADEAQMRSYLGVISRSMDEAVAKRAARRAAGEDVDPEGPSWALIQALEAGLPLTQLPFLRDKLLRFFQSELCNMDEFRVRLDAGAFRRYLMVDPFVFNENGDFDPSGAVLRRNWTVIPGHSMARSAFVHRQPNASWNEGFMASVIDHPRFHDVDHKSPFLFVSIDILRELLEACGGGDLDDACVVHTAADMVARAAELLKQPYPGKKVTL